MKLQAVPLLKKAFIYFAFPNQFLTDGGWEVRADAMHFRQAVRQCHKLLELPGSVPQELRLARSPPRPKH